MKLTASVQINTHKRFCLKKKQQQQKKLALLMHECNLSGYHHISGFRCLSESSKNGFEVHFECEFLPFRIQTLTWSHPC